MGWEVIPRKRLPHVPTIVVELCGGSLDAEAVEVPEIPLVGRPIARLVLQVLGHLVDGQPVAVSRPVAEVLRAHLDLPPLPRLVRAVEDGRGEGVRVQARLPLTRVEQRQEHHCRDRGKDGVQKQNRLNAGLRHGTGSLDAVNHTSSTKFKSSAIQTFLCCFVFCRGLVIANIARFSDSTSLTKHKQRPETLDAGRRTLHNSKWSLVPLHYPYPSSHSQSAISMSSLLSRARDRSRKRKELIKNALGVQVSEF